MFVTTFSKAGVDQDVGYLGRGYFSRSVLFQPSTHGVGGLWGGKSLTLTGTFGPVPDRYTPDSVDEHTKFRDDEVREVRVVIFDFDP